MNRRGFLGALTAAVVAPWLPKIAKAESSHASGGQQIITKVDRDTKTIDLDWFSEGYRDTLGRGYATTYTLLPDGKIKEELSGGLE